MFLVRFQFTALFDFVKHSAYFLVKVSGTWWLQMKVWKCHPSFTKAAVAVGSCKEWILGSPHAPLPFCHGEESWAWCSLVQSLECSLGCGGIPSSAALAPSVVLWQKGIWWKWGCRKRARLLVCTCVAICRPCKTALWAGEVKSLALGQRGADIFEVSQPGKEWLAEALRFQRQLFTIWLETLC